MTVYQMTAHCLIWNRWVLEAFRKMKKFDIEALKNA